MRRINILWSFVISLLPLLTLWYLFFHPGLYAYSDQHFPLSTKIPASSIISLNSLNGFSFDRLFITFPYYIFSFFTSSIAVIERLFFYYVFLVYAFLCYVFSSLAVNYYSERVHRLSGLESNGGKLAILIVAYSNLSALNLNSDGGAWADSVILILISISIILILKDSRSLKTYLIISALMMFSIMLDPDYIPMFWIAVILVSLVKALMQKGDMKGIAYSVLSVFISIISIMYLYLQGLFSGSLTSTALGALGYRAYSAGNVAFFSSNITPYNVLILVGHLWSTIVYAPPSVLLYQNIFNLPTLYYPAQVAVIPGLIYYIWIASLISIPVLAFSTLIFKSTRKFSLPVLTLFVAAYLVTQEWNLRIIYRAFHFLVYVPVFGGAIGTAFTLPGHFINLIAYTYLPLLSLGVLNIIYYSSRFSLSMRKKHEIQYLKSSNDKMDQHVRRRKPRLKTFLSMVVIILLLSLAGWQAFSGSNYPMRAYPGSFVVGNSIDPKGVFAPTEVNASVIHAYNIAVSNYSEGYNTLWIGGPTVNDFTYSSPPNGVSENSFSYLVSNNLWFDVKPYLEAHSVRYVVISGEDIAKTVPNPFTGYGFENYLQANSFFQKSGMKSIYSEGNVSVYELTSVVGPAYYSNILLNTTSAGSQSAVFYSLFSEIGLNASFSARGSNIGVNNVSDSINVITPPQLLESHIVSPAVNSVKGIVNSSYFRVFKNSTNYQGNIEYYQNNSLGQYVNYLPGNFTTTNWGGNVSFNYKDGTLIASGQNSSFSVGYNGSLTGQPGGLSIGSHNISLEFTISYSANVTTDFKGTSALSIIGEAENSSKATYIEDIPFNVSDHTKKYEFNTTIPRETSYVGFRIGFYGFSGTVNLPFVNFTISSLSVPYAESPFGCFVSVKNATLSVPDGFSSGFVIYTNNSNSFPFFREIYQNHNLSAFNGDIQAVVLLKKGANNNFLGNYVVINEAINRADRVGFNGSVLRKYYSGTDGSYIYPVNTPGIVVLSVQKHLVYALDAYYIIIMIMSVLLIFIGLKLESVTMKFNKLQIRNR